MKYPSKQSEVSSRDDFLLAIIHDMRAHLRASLTSAQLLERSTGSSLAPAVLEQLAQIISANKDLDVLLSRLSDYASASHLGKGKPISLGTALQTALLQFPSWPVELKPVTDEAGKQSIRQEYVRIFVELIDNALKFSSGRPVSVEVAFADDTSTTSVKIVDIGIGIDPADVEGVFLPLTRLNAYDQFPGAGLGLPICRRIADAAGATVQLAPAPDKGAVATVTLNASA
jgi:two-component system, chemotaxis family, sensor kinase Cph1